MKPLTWLALAIVLGTLMLAGQLFRSINKIPSNGREQASAAMLESEEMSLDWQRIYDCICLNLSKVMIDSGGHAENALLELREFFENLSARDEAVMLVPLSRRERAALSTLIETVRNVAVWFQIESGLERSAAKAAVEANQELQLRIALWPLACTLSALVEDWFLAIGSANDEAQAIEGFVRIYRENGHTTLVEVSEEWTLLSIDPDQAIWLEAVPINGYEFQSWVGVTMDDASGGLQFWKSKENPISIESHSLYSVIPLFASP